MQSVVLVLCLTLGSDFSLIGDAPSFALAGCPGGVCSRPTLAPSTTVDAIPIECSQSCNGPTTECTSGSCNGGGCSMTSYSGQSFDYQPRRTFRRGGIFRGRSGGSCRGCR